MKIFQKAALLAFACALICSGPAGAQSLSSEKQSAPIQNLQLPAPMLSTVGASAEEREFSVRVRELERDEKDLRAQESMATAAWAMFFATAFGVLLTGVTLWLLKKTLDATENSVSVVEAQVRAYLAGGNGDFIINQAGNSLGIGVALRIQNVGNSPALNVKTESFIGAFAPADVKEKGAFVNLIGTLTPSAETMFQVFFPFDMMEKQTKEWIMDKGYPITTATVLTWADVFGSDHSLLIEGREPGVPPSPPFTRALTGVLMVTNHGQHVGGESKAGPIGRFLSRIRAKRQA
jgi:hypothetical protein